MRVDSLHVYPVKGCRGIDVARAEVRAGGFANDRRFMILDADGVFVTQREQARLALVETAIDGERLVLRAGGRAAILPLAGHRGPTRRVKVWDDEVEAVVVDGEAPALISAHLGVPASLVYMPEDTVRPVEAPHGRPGDRVGFADAYPILVASLASLGDLNERLLARGEAAVPMTRFRPNVVVAGGEAFAEDAAATMTIGALTVRTPKPCARCQVVTIDQQTAAKGKEPLRTLARYRSQANKVNFAVNAIPDLPGGPLTIAIGDPVAYAPG